MLPNVVYPPQLLQFPSPPLPIRPTNGDQLLRFPAFHPRSTRTDYGDQYVQQLAGLLPKDELMRKVTQASFGWRFASVSGLTYLSAGWLRPARPQRAY